MVFSKLQCQLHKSQFSNYPIQSIEGGPGLFAVLQCLRDCSEPLLVLAKIEVALREIA
jgi:hypothetical protein